MSAILGISLGHADTAACLVVDGKLKSAIAEERLGDRIKHSPRFPSLAVRRVLDDAGLRLKDVTHVALARDPNANARAKVRHVISQPVRSAGAVVQHFARRGNPSESLSNLAKNCDTDPQQLRFQTVRIEHHLAHIASAYYLSPFDRMTAGFSFDGSGDFVSAMAARCEGNRIEVLDRVFLPNSLGFFYTALSQFVGFDAYGEEYKVMGLTAYGDDNYRDLMARLVRFDDHRWFQLQRDYFGMHEGGQSGDLDQQGHIKMGRMYTDHLIAALGPPRQRSGPITNRERDLAKSMQVRFEEVVTHCFRRLHRLVPTNQVAYAGGCALNGVANARILRDTPFDSVYIQSAASDDGTALGAAYYCYHNVVGGSERFHMDHAYWGPEYGDDQFKNAAQSCGMAMGHFPGPQLQQIVAKMLHDRLVVGWYQGRAEWGPRALGNRSILANPTDAQMPHIINTKIKRREQFRPFAPTVLKEHVGTYFEQDVLSPFMMHVVKIRQPWRAKLAAVAHVDGTGRLQTLERQHNPRYYDLIMEFAKRSGVYAVLNTSFNENEPIVDTPEQAVNCFLRNDIDALCLGDYIVCKPPHAARIERHESRVPRPKDQPDTCPLTHDS